MRVALFAELHAPEFFQSSQSDMISKGSGTLFEVNLCKVELKLK